MSFLKRLFGGKQSTGPQKEYVLNVSDDDFQTQVIRRSHKETVMVDYWAAWCGPCRMLGPVLEDLAMEDESGFVLAKLDTEANPRMAARYEIRSIPAIKVFRNGQVVGEFQGLMPAHNIKKFIAKINEVAPPPPRLKVPKNPAQRLKQAKQHLKKGRGFEASVFLMHFPDGPEAEQAEKLRPLARFLCDIDDGDWPSGSKVLDGIYLDAADAIADGAPEIAISKMLEALEDASAPKLQTKEALQGLLVMLGHQHQLTKTYSAQIEAIAA